jgi:hypothetical protein
MTIKTVDISDNFETNEELMKNLTFNIAMIRSQEGKGIVIPEELKDSITKVEQRLGNTVVVDEKQLFNIINKKGLLEIENEELTGLIFDFIQENNLSSKFYKFLEKRKREDNYCLDIDFLMLDYKEEN